MKAKAPLVLEGGVVINRREDRLHVDPRNRDTVAKQIVAALDDAFRAQADPEDILLRRCDGCTMVALVDTFNQLFPDPDERQRFARDMAEVFGGMAISGACEVDKIR
jgi:hypothetical protein